jgi:phospholipid/cholesterol/gamma-HCH transport system permease protein
MHDSRAKNLMWVGASGRLLREKLAGLGGMAREQLVAVRYLAAVLGTTLFLSAQPRRWGRVVRGIFARQFFFSGVESVRFILIVAVLVGISVVVQLSVWTDRLGQSQKLGPLLVVVVARELGPLFANFVLIVRGGSAIATELGIMKVGGEIRVLEAQGLEPLLFLVMPRVLAMALSAFCLTIIFVLAAFASGYGFSVLFGGINMDPEVFLKSVFKAVHPLDAIGFLVKCILPAVLTGVICSTEGLSVEGGVTQVPLAAKRALARSLFALLLTSTVVSLLTYS